MNITKIFKYIFYMIEHLANFELIRALTDRSV
jgi:hypothetical protein